MEMKVNAVLKVLEGNRITLPKDICKELGIDKGDLVGIILEKSECPRLVVIPVEVVPRNKYSE